MARSISTVQHIEEGRAARESPHYKFGYFLSISQQGVSADIIQNSAVVNFSPLKKKKDSLPSSLTVDILPGSSTYKYKFQNKYTR